MIRTSLFILAVLLLSLVAMPTAATDVRFEDDDRSLMIRYVIQPVDAHDVLRCSSALNELYARDPHEDVKPVVDMFRVLSEFVLLQSDDLGQGQFLIPPGILVDSARVADTALYRMQMDNQSFGMRCGQYAGNIVSKIGRAQATHVSMETPTDTMPGKRTSESSDQSVGMLSRMQLVADDFTDARKIECLAALNYSSSVWDRLGAFDPEKLNVARNILASSVAQRVDVGEIDPTGFSALSERWALFYGPSANALSQGQMTNLIRQSVDVSLQCAEQFWTNYVAQEAK